MISKKCRKCEFFRRKSPLKVIRKNEYCYCTKYDIVWHHTTETLACEDAGTYHFE